MEQGIWDFQQLWAFQQAMDTLDLQAPPTAQVLHPHPLPPARRVGLLCGSFNPLTLAHTELAKHTRETAELDLVLFTLAKVTIEKERVTGLSLADRLLLLSLYARRQDGIGVALVNRGLYFEQAQGFRALFGADTRLSFVVGMDKLLQIFDAKYYRDRDAALQQLFSLTSLIVANRGAMAREEFDQFLDRPENRPYRQHIQFCPLPEAVADLSATEVREALASGKSVDDLVPNETAAFLEETQAFRPLILLDAEHVDAYGIRQRVFHLLSVNQDKASASAFRTLFQEALQDDDRGRAVRAALTVKQR